MDNSMQSKQVGEQLRAPFPAKLVSWRVGKTNPDGSRGQALPYISPRAVQDRLDEVVGPAAWSNSFEAVTLGESSSSVIATIKLLLDGNWIAKSDASQLDSFAEEANREIAVKGVYSDSFKRAAVLWGIGRYLYAYEAPWVALDNGRLAEIPKLPAHMLPEGERTAQVETTVEKQSAPSEKVAAPQATDTAASEAAAADAAAHEAAAEAAATAAAEAAAIAATEAAANAAATAAAEAEAKAAATAAAEAEAKAAATAAAEAEAKAAATAAAEAEAKAKAAATATAAAAADAAAKAAAAAAQAAKPDDEALARERAAAVVDQEMGGGVAAGAPASNATGEDALRASLNAEQRKTFDGLLEKIKKNLPTQMLRNYVRSPKAEAALPLEARTHILTLLDKADAAKAAA